MLIWGIHGAAMSTAHLEIETGLTMLHEFPEPGAQAIWSTGMHLEPEEYLLAAGLGFGLGVGIGAVAPLRPSAALTRSTSQGLGEEGDWVLGRYRFSAETGDVTRSGTHMPSGTAYEVMWNLYSHERFFRIEGGPWIRFSSRTGGSQPGAALLPARYPPTGPGSPPSFLTSSLAEEPSLLAGEGSPAALPPASVSFADFDLFLQETFAPGASSEARYLVTPEGIAFPEPPISNLADYVVTRQGETRGSPIGPGIPLYFGSLPVPPADFGQTQILRGRIPQDVTPFEYFAPELTMQLTSDTLSQARQTPYVINPELRGRARGARGEIYWTERNPSATHGGSGVRVPITGAIRYPDVRQNFLRYVLAGEVKNYLRYRNPGSGLPTEVREVALSTRLRQQITGDALLMNYTSGYRPYWVFVDAPPSPALAAELEFAGIPYLFFGDRGVP